MVGLRRGVFSKHMWIFVIYKMTDISGDFFKTPFPAVDLFVVSRVLRNMSEKERNDLLSKCHKALNPGMHNASLAI